MGFEIRVAQDSPFTLENIPFEVISTRDDTTPRCATAVGDYAVDLRALSGAGFFQDPAVADSFCQVCR